jgi:hypothetical protein
MEIKKIEEPKLSASDYLHKGIKALIGSLPGVGSIAAEVFATVFEAPIAKRRSQWINLIAESLIQLEKKVDGLNIEDLSRNEMFITTALQATQISLRNHQREKIEMLRNAVLNSALPNAPEDDVQLMFLNLIDILTLTHITALSVLDNPDKWIAKYGLKYDLKTRPDTIIESIFSDFKQKREYYELIASELFSKGLIKENSLHLKSNAYGGLAKMSTSMGRHFLVFISSPL